MAETIRTACTRDCPDACGMIATVDGGRVVGLAGDPDHPVTRGFLCYRTNRFLERQYAEDRLTKPLLRDGDGFREATWDEALDCVASTLLRVRDESGGSAILHFRSGGSMGLMKHVTEYLFERFGPVAVKSGDICSGAGEAAQEADFGVSDSHDLFDLENSRTIVLWGKNPFVSNVHLIPILKNARARGARIVQIDPVRHRGAEIADLYLQPRPGGDAALGLGVARVLFEIGRVDPAAGSYCDHLEEFRTLAFRHGADEWAEIAGVTPGQLTEFVASYATGPSAILVGWGMQRRARGSAAVRVLDALGAVSGNLGVAGGGVSFYFQRRGAFDLSFVRGLSAAPRSIPESRLGPGILAADDPPVRAVWVTAGNPVAMLPESETTRRALATREMTVVVDSFLTDTARCAHVVLPTTTMLEDDDLVGAFGHHWIAEVRPAVPAPEGVLTDYEIGRRLASRLGLGAEFDRSVEDWKRRLLSRVAPQGASLEALGGGAVRNPEAPRVLFEGRRFPTPSGRVNLIREIDPSPPAAEPEYPFLLTAIATAKAQASQWPAASQRGPATATVHPEAASKFRDGDRARLVSRIAAVEVVLRFDDRQRRDVLLMDKGGWLSAGRCANALIPARTTDAGGGAVYYDTPVRLEPL